MMRHVLKPELLDALKGRLWDLENAKLIGPADLGIIDEKRVLRQQIAALEKNDSDQYDLAG
jgi:hypothetical protein